MSVNSARVMKHTDPGLNAQFRADVEARVERLAAEGPQAIETRLRELEREWDIERVLEANAGSLAAMSALLAATNSRRWLLLTGVVGTFLTQHAVQGWCPPVPLFRRLGYRTTAEIDYERVALRAARGDFTGREDDPAAALDVAARTVGLHQR
ncbi:DUF2892 domain-containing protein [Ectothiorhodospiraceae bacterium 2226]|nr:DUF2892 domain-containing protein [Ectothiorhodospiraceae bacterium 2226]